jgi:protein TonB
MRTPALQARLPPAQDRMVTTLFVAGLLHGILILGVTFSTPGNDAASDQAPGLEVILVNDQGSAVAQNRDARYLAQRTQQGSGNTLDEGRALIPKSSLAAADRPGTVEGNGTEIHAAGQDIGDDQTLSTRAPAARIVYLAAVAQAKDAAELPLLLEKRPDLGMTPNDDGIALRLRGATRERLWVAADTRESDVAVYLDAWRRKVERVGTVNFPLAARRRKLSGTPVIEVTIDADGRLDSALVRRSSGHAEIDDAAVRILKLAAPYQPFPRELGAKHDQIRIAYEWQFLGGADAGSSVVYSAP